MSRCALVADTGLGPRKRRRPLVLKSQNCEDDADHGASVDRVRIGRVAFVKVTRRTTFHLALTDVFGYNLLQQPRKTSMNHLVYCTQWE